MKRALLIASLAIGLVFSLVGCEGGGEGTPEVTVPCEHPYSEWIQGETTHYQICPECGQRHDEEEHRYENLAGLTYTLRQGTSAILRVRPPEGEEGKAYMVKEVWVYVNASSGTLRLGHGASSSSVFNNYDDLKLTGKREWVQIPLKEELPNSVYGFFRLEAIDSEIPIREIVFFGAVGDGPLEMMCADATKKGEQEALVDCRQEPGSYYACTVCGKVRP